mgnify:CR=1 FL=1
MITMNTGEMIDRLVATDEHLANAACEITVEIDEILTARQWIDALFESNRRLAEQVLDAISDSYGSDMSGSWEDDGENMILLTWDEYEMEYGDEQ